MKVNKENNNNNNVNNTLMQSVHDVVLYLHVSYFVPI